MKKSLVIIFCFILVLSLTFVSAGLFENFWKKITGKVAESQDSGNELFSEGVDDFEEDVSESEIRKSVEKEKVEEEIQDINGIDNYQFSENQVPYVLNDENLDYENEITFSPREKNFLRRIFSFFGKEKKLIININFNNLPFEPEEITLIGIHDISTNKSWKIGSNIDYNETITIILEDDFLKWLDQFGINIDNSNLGIFMGGSGFLGDKIKGSKKGFIVTSENNIKDIKNESYFVMIYVTKFQEKIFVDGNNLKKINIDSNYLTELGLIRSKIQIPYLGTSRYAIICMSYPCNYPIVKMNYFIGEGNSLEYPYFTDIEFHLVKQEEKRTMVLLNAKDFFYPWTGNLSHILKPSDFKEINFKILKTFHSFIFDRFNVHSDGGYSSNDLPLDYIVKCNSEDNSFHMISYYHDGPSLRAVSQWINLSKVDGNFKTYNLFKKPIGLDLDYSEKEGIALMESVLVGKIPNNEFAFMYFPYYYFIGSNYVYPGYIKITKPDGSIHENTEGGIGSWGLNCDKKESQCDASSPSFPDFGYCDDGTYRVEWLYTNVSIGDTFFLNETFEIKDCEFILEDIGPVQNN